MSGGLPFPPPAVLPCCYALPPLCAAIAKVFAKLSPAAASELPPPPLHGEDHLVLCCAAASLRRTARPAWFGHTAACCSCLRNLDTASTKPFQLSQITLALPCPRNWRSKVGASRPRLVGSRQQQLWRLEAALSCALREPGGASAASGKEGPWLHTVLSFQHPIPSWCNCCQKPTQIQMTCQLSHTLYAAPTSLYTFEQVVRNSCSGSFID